jgi:hypothetical protein
MSGYSEAEAWRKYFGEREEGPPSGWRGAIELTENFERFAPDYLKGAFP